ncbi:alpha/beta fold hydrolase [Bradyrhizobium sacchari]|uniref:alpha/beta fold hydrolase n=1 Tax=Bradyrhizobium sacchari TaxID=1399419 RepID=UPI0013747AED|nr:alpha/beta hydrolase [Bradyrhizobium sacchari]
MGLLAGGLSLSMSVISNAGSIEGKRNAGQKPAWLTLPPTPALPATTRKGLAAINGVKVFYAQFGNGPSLLLLHGGLASSNYWKHQIEFLSRDYTVTVMDTRGHGRSPLSSAEMKYRLFAEDAVALLDHLSISKTTIIGWSDGAITGLQVALTRPNRLSGLFAFGANSNLDGLKPGGAKTGVFPSFGARCRKEYVELSPAPERWPELQRSLGIMWRSEPNFSKNQLREIGLPVAIVDGQYDEIIKPENVRQMASSIRNAQLVILPNVSHFAMLQDVGAFNHAVRQFLSKSNPD